MVVTDMASAPTAETGSPSFGDDNRLQALEEQLRDLDLAGRRTDLSETPRR